MFPRQNKVNEDYLLDIKKPILKVIGLGGGGCNAIERMIENNLRGIQFIAANTDDQVLRNNHAPVKIQLGPNYTRGLGAGGDPKIGRAAAEESRWEISEALAGADMVFLTAGMGGGTGTGAIPVVAEIAREQGSAVIAIVTTPFSFEMGRRQRNAREGLELLREHTHTLATIPNDRLLYVAPRNLPMEVAFRLADDVLRQAVQGISEIIYEPGLINVDFAHVQRLIRLGGGALMAIGQGSGNRKVQQALEQALHHPLLDDFSLENAAGIIANFTGGDDLCLSDIEYALSHLNAQAGSQTEIVMGVIQNPTMKDRLQVTLMVTGLGASTLEETMKKVQYSSKEPIQVNLPKPIEETVHMKCIPGNKVDSLVLNNNLDIPAFLRKRSRLITV